MNITAIIESRIRRALSALRLPFRARLTALDGQPKLQLAQGQALAGEQMQAVEIVQQFGFTSGVPTGSQLIVLPLTLADGTKIGWNGIGGVNKFVWDEQADTLRLPDLAGMTPEQVGYDPLGVGGVRGDMIRNIRGSMQRSPQPDAGYIYIDSHLVGAFAIDKTSELSSTTMAGTKAGTFPTRMIFEPSRVVPTGPRNHGPRYISDARVYLGQPVL